MHGGDPQQVSGRIAGRGEIAAFIADQALHRLDLLGKHLVQLVEHRLVRPDTPGFHRRAHGNAQVGATRPYPGKKFGHPAHHRFGVVDPPDEHGFGDQHPGKTPCKHTNTLEDFVQAKGRMRPVDASPDRLVHTVHLHRHPVGQGQFAAHLLLTEQRAVGHHGHRYAQGSQQFDGLTQVHIQGRFTIRHKGQVIDPLPLLPQLCEPVRHCLHDLLSCIKRSASGERMGRAAHLTVHTGIGAVLGRDVVDAKTPPQPPGRHRTEKATTRFLGHVPLPAGNPTRPCRSCARAG